jgi:hypothetical protein
MIDTHVYAAPGHPNDSPKDGTIHEIAVRQLAAWEAIASQWVLVRVGSYLRCCECRQAVVRLIDDKGQDYQTSDTEILALKVAHLRQRHPELERHINASD